MYERCFVFSTFYFRFAAYLCCKSGVFSVPHSALSSFAQTSQSIIFFSGNPSEPPPCLLLQRLRQPSSSLASSVITPPPVVFFSIFCDGFAARRLPPPWRLHRLIFLQRFSQRLPKSAQRIVPYFPGFMVVECFSPNEDILKKKKKKKCTKKQLSPTLRISMK